LHAIILSVSRQEEAISYGLAGSSIYLYKNPLRAGFKFFDSMAADFNNIRILIQ